MTQCLNVRYHLTHPFGCECGEKQIHNLPMNKKVAIVALAVSAFAITCFSAWIVGVALAISLSSLSGIGTFYGCSAFFKQRMVSVQVPPQPKTVVAPKKVKSEPIPEQKPLPSTKKKDLKKQKLKSIPKKQEKKINPNRILLYPAGTMSDDRSGSTVSDDMLPVFY